MNAGKKKLSSYVKIDIPERVIVATAKFIVPRSVRSTKAIGMCSEMMFIFLFPALLSCFILSHQEVHSQTKKLYFIATIVWIHAIREKKNEDENKILITIFKTTCLLFVPIPNCCPQRKVEVIQNKL